MQTFITYYLELCSLFLCCRIPLVVKLSFPLCGSCRAQVYYHSAQPQSLLALLLPLFHVFCVFISDFLFLLFIKYGRLQVIKYLNYINLAVTTFCNLKVGIYHEFSPLTVTGCLVGHEQWEVSQCFKTALEFLESKVFKVQ